MNHTLDDYWVTAGQPWAGPVAVGAAGSTYSAPQAATMVTNIRLKLSGLSTPIALWTTANVAVMGLLLVAFTGPNNQSRSGPCRLFLTRMRGRFSDQRSAGI
jgi:hypothetical protein